MYNHSIPRSVVGETAVDSRSVLRVRNIRESSVYHLTFDGDIGRLTGYQLRSHIKSICGVPVEQQILTFNDQNVHNESTGYEIGLRPGSTLILDFANRARESEEFFRTRSVSQSALPKTVSSYPVSQEQSSKPSQIQTKIMTPFQRHAAADEDNEVDVEVEVIAEENVDPWVPATSVEAEEARLLSQDYAWRMEQVRFETERMHREREMMRQRQELEYQSELLERERLELERKTRAEKLKLSLMHNAMQEEMAIQAHISSYHEISHPIISRYN